MLISYVKKYPSLDLFKIPSEYKLGKGHMIFFKNKLKYLEKRFKTIKIEMKKRGFSAEIKVDLVGFNKELIKDWKPTQKDKEIIKKRIVEKINLKPNYYRYYGVKKSKKFFIELIKNVK
jgi:deoxyribonuclease (pyrimidine dimer)